MGKTIKKKQQHHEQQQLNKKQDRLEKKRLKKQEYCKVKDYQSNEERKFANELLLQGYQIEYIDADGNCLFRSISHQLYGVQDRHGEIRHDIMNYIEANSDHFQLFIEDDETFDDYLSRMRTHGEWGGHQELFAASQVFNLNIHVHQLDAPQFLLPASGLGKNPTIREIHLSYHGEYHYNSLNSVAGHTSEICEITETCQKLTINEQSIFDQVKQCLPWRSDECILNGLKKCQYNFDETVEYLINDPSSDVLEEEKKDIDEKNKIEENIPPERHSKVKIKKSKDKQNEPVISKKEQRKKKKHKDTSQRPETPPPPCPSSNGVIVL